MDVPTTIALPELPEVALQAADLLAQGCTLAEVVNATGFTRIQIGTWQAVPEFKEYLAKKQDEYQSAVKTRVSARLHAKAEEAVEKIAQIMQTGDKSQRTQLEAADRIVDRVLPRKGEGAGGTAVQINISFEEAQRMAAAAREARVVTFSADE